MSEHTQGRMEHHALMGTIGGDSVHGTSIFHCGLGLRHHSFSAEQVANARRIVACWNACEKLPTDMLEQVPEAAVARVRYQTVMQALRECRHELASAQQGCPDPECSVCKSNRESLARYDATINANAPTEYQKSAHGGADVYGNADGTR